MNIIRYFGFSSQFDFLSYRKASLTFSLILVLASFFSISFMGLNLGIDFKGGVLIEARMKQDIDLSVLRQELNGLGLGSVGLQSFGSDNDILITLPKQNATNDQDEASAQKAAIDLIQTTLGSPESESSRVSEYRRVETVGPSVSEELKSKAFWATIYALIGISLYIAFRFEWRFAAAALAALIHDVITTAGFFSISGFEFNLTTVAAILTTAGYSINDTVVVFDRVREELKRYKKKPTIEILNLALNLTLTRTTMTSLTTLLALITLALVAGPVIRGFSVALIWGVVIGTYSSLFVATPILLALRLKRHVFDEREKTASDDGAAAYIQKLAKEEQFAREFDKKQGMDKKKEDTTNPTSRSQGKSRNNRQSGKKKPPKGKPWS